jgi:hypothetical protein
VAAAVDVGIERAAVVDDEGFDLAAAALEDELRRVAGSEIGDACDRNERVRHAGSHSRPLAQ